MRSIQYLNDFIFHKIVHFVFAWNTMDTQEYDVLNFGNNEN